MFFFSYLSLRFLPFRDAFFLIPFTKKHSFVSSAFDRSRGKGSLESQSGCALKTDKEKEKAQGDHLW